MAIITEFNKLNNSPRMKEFIAAMNSLNGIPLKNILEIINSVVKLDMSWKVESA